MIVQTNDWKDAVDVDHALVVFSATWCQPCRNLKPQLVKVNSQIDSDIYIVDVDMVGQDVLDFYNIQSVPTVFIMERGKVVRAVDARTAPEILEQMSEVIHS